MLSMIGRIIRLTNEYVLFAALSSLLPFYILWPETTANKTTTYYFQIANILMCNGKRDQIPQSKEKT